MIGENVKKLFPALTNAKLNNDIDLIEAEIVAKAYLDMKELIKKANSCDYWHNKYVELQKETKQADKFSYSE